MIERGDLLAERAVRVVPEVLLLARLVEVPVLSLHHLVVPYLDGSLELLCLPGVLEGLVEEEHLIILFELNTMNTQFVEKKEELHLRQSVSLQVNVH